MNDQISTHQSRKPLGDSQGRQANGNVSKRCVLSSCPVRRSRPSRLLTSLLLFISHRGRLQSELMSLMMSAPPGISAFPVSDEDMLDWAGTITGVEGTPYEGLTFKSESYLFEERIETFVVVFGKEEMSPTSFVLRAPMTAWICSLLSVAIGLRHLAGAQNLGSLARRWLARTRDSVDSEAGFCPEIKSHKLSGIRQAQLHAKANACPNSTHASVPASSSYRHRTISKAPRTMFVQGSYALSTFPSATLPTFCALYSQDDIPDRIPIQEPHRVLHHTMLPPKHQPRRRHLS